MAARTLSAAALACLALACASTRSAETARAPDRSGLASVTIRIAGPG